MNTERDVVSLRGDAEDCRAVLELNSSARPCYNELAVADLLGGSSGEPLLKRALDVCPRSYNLHLTRVFLAMPRWDGSIPEMERTFDEARAHGLDRVRVDALRS